MSLLPCTWVQFSPPFSVRMIVPAKPTAMPNLDENAIEVIEFEVTVVVRITFPSITRAVTPSSPAT
jgi:hypothetical protein